MPPIWKELAFVATIAGVVMFTNLGGARLWDRDEPRNAGCAAEMQARGDWVTPVFDAELRTHKPVLLYWLIMTAYSLFGINEFSARFWSAALAVGTAMCTYLMGRHLFGAKVGVWAGIILASTLMFDVAGRAATPDSPLIFFSTLAITIYVLRGLPQAESVSVPGDTSRPYFPSWRGAIAMYAVMGVAMLAKGPVGLILPTAVIGMFLLIVRLPNALPQRESHGRWWWCQRVAQVFAPKHFFATCWSMRPLTALCVSLAVAAPWYVWVGMRTDGAFLRGFFLEHNVGRAMQSMEGHGGSILFYPLAILVGFFPWSVFAVPVVLDAYRHGRVQRTWQPGYLLAACWVGVYVAIFSLAKTKLPSYVTPCYPALATATACFVQRWTNNSLATSRNWLRVALVITSMVGIVMLIGLPIAAHRYLPGDEWLGVIGLLPLASGLITLYLVERHRHVQAAIVFGALAVLCMATTFGGVTALVDRHQHNDVLLQAIAERGEDSRVVSFGLLEPSWVFYGRRPIEEVHHFVAQVPHHARVEVAGRWVPKRRVTVNDLLVQSDDLLIITNDFHLPKLREILPDDFEVLAQSPHFMRKGNLMVLGRRESEQTARERSTGATLR